MQDATPPTGDAPAGPGPLDDGESQSAPTLDSQSAGNEPPAQQRDQGEPASQPEGPSRSEGADEQGPAQPTEGSGAHGPKGKRPTAIVRFGRMRHIGEFRHNLDPTPSPGKQVVVRTERGVEIGTVVVPVESGARPRRVEAAQLENFIASNGPEYPFRRDGRILRAANRQDLIDHRHLTDSARDEGSFCREQITELELEMKLVSVEHLLGGERIVFFFTATTRVDFRELVRRLASEYRTRIEMRQVGARDEARLLGDYERCGQQCCCQRFLKDLRPVSMRMAKSQKATLDPTKISGRCGRLMCCLRYEDACYEELRKQLPRRKTWVRTEDLVGKVVETQILTQLVRLALPGGTTTVVGNEDIIERDMDAPTPEELAAAAAAKAAAPARKSEPRPPADDERYEEPAKDAGEVADSDAAPAGGRGEGPDAERPRRSRRGRRGGGRVKQHTAGARGKSGSAPSGGKGAGQKRPPGRSARRRRRRKGKGGSQGSGAGGPQGKPVN